MEGKCGASGKTQHGGRSGFGVLPALTGLPTSISCQRCSKMVARAACRCTGKRGSLLRMERRRKGGGGGWKRRCRGGRGEREGRINSNPSSSSFCFSVSFCQLSFSSVVVIACTENGEEKIRGQEGRFLRMWFSHQNTHV